MNHGDVVNALSSPRAGTNSPYQPVLVSDGYVPPAERVLNVAQQVFGKFKCAKCGFSVIHLHLTGKSKTRFLNGHVHAKYFDVLMISGFTIGVNI